MAKRYDVADLSLADEGKRRILWADNDMPVPGGGPRAVREGKAPQGHGRSARACT